MTTYTKTEFKKFAVKAARAADAKKAENIKLLDTTQAWPLADFVLIATVDSAAQMEAVDYGIGKELKKIALFKIHRDGTDSRLWRVLDYGGFIVHILMPETREFYGLDRLYHLAKPVRWEAAVIKKPARPAKKR